MHWHATRTQHFLYKTEMPDPSVKKKCLRHKSILDLLKYIFIFMIICKITIIIEAQIKRYRGPRHRYIGINYSCESLPYSSQPNLSGLGQIANPNFTSRRHIVTDEVMIER